MIKVVGISIYHWHLVPLNDGFAFEHVAFQNGGKDIDFYLYKYTVNMGVELLSMPFVYSASQFASSAGSASIYV